MSNINKIKRNILMYIYIVLMISIILMRIPIVQHVLIILMLFILNGILINKFKVKNKGFKGVSIFIIILNIILLYISYNQILNLGFNDGLARGFIYKINYWDDYNYYYESEILKDYWLRGNVFNWFHGVVPQKMFYGYYNIFVIFIALLKLLIGNNLISLILFKLQFTIVSIYLVYYISSYLINEKYSIIPVLLTNLFPAYLQTNISLIRDNIILFFTLLVFYQINFKKINKVILVINIILLSYLRPYVGVPVALLSYTYNYINSEKFNIKKLIEYVFIVIGFIFILGVFLQIRGYGFLAIDAVKKMSDSGNVGKWNAKVVASPLNLIFYNFKYLFLGGRVSNFSTFVYDNLLVSSYLFIPIICLATLLLFLLPNISNKIKKFNLIIFVLAFSIHILILYVFGGNVPRLYIPWFWGQTILFTYLIKYMKSVFKRDLVVFTGINYLIFCMLVVKFYVK